MWDLLSQPTTQAALSVLALVVVCVVAYHGVLKLRDFNKDDISTDLNSLTKFEELRLEGEISESEFRSIQAAMKAQSSDETASNLGVGKSSS